MWDAIQYLAATRCQWAQLPRDFAPFKTVQYHFYRMRDNGPLDAVRVVEGRNVEPTAGIIGSQPIKTTGISGPRGF